MSAHVSASSGGRYGFVFLARLHAKDIPGDIRPEVFASNLPAGRPLDKGAIFSGDAAVFVFPLANGAFADPQQVTKGTLGADDFHGLIKGIKFCGLVHLSGSLGYLLLNYPESMISRPSCLQKLAPSSQQILYSQPAMQDLSKWVRDARQAKAMTQQQLGDHLGVTKGNVSSWEVGRHKPSYSQVQKITEITGVLPPGYEASQPAELMMAGGSGRPILAWEHTEDLPPGEFVMVPRLNVKLSAGAGREQVEIELAKTTPQAFRADWIRGKHYKPTMLAAMSASGDSMEPRIHDGDTLLIDTSAVNVVDGRVYALWYDGGERVKRLFRRPGGGLSIRSDNPQHPPMEVPQAELEFVRLIGRVVAVSGTGGL